MLTSTSGKVVILHEKLNFLYKVLFPRKIILKVYGVRVHLIEVVLTQWKNFEKL